MAEPAPVSRTPLAGIAATTTRPAPGIPAGLTVTERAPGIALQVISRRGCAPEAAAGIARTVGIEAPLRPSITLGAGVCVLWTGPDQWTVLADAAAPDLEARLANALKGSASLVDQSAGRVVVEIAGPRVRDALASLVGIDVDASVFAIGGAALTPIAHMSVQIWRLPDRGGAPVFMISGARSSARSLWHAIVSAASQYGVDAKPLGA